MVTWEERLAQSPLMLPAGAGYSMEESLIPYHPARSSTQIKKSRDIFT